MRERGHCSFRRCRGSFLRVKGVFIVVHVKAAILELQELIDSGEQEQHDLQQFLRNVRKYTDPEELTAEILNDLVDRIVVHAPDKSSGHRKQKIEIYYKTAGIINIADEDCVALDGRLGMQNRKKKTA